MFITTNSFFTYDAIMLHMLQTKGQNLCVNLKNLG